MHARLSSSPAPRMCARMHPPLHEERNPHWSVSKRRGKEGGKGGVGGEGGRGKGEGEGVLSGPFYAPLASLTSLHQHIYVYIQSDYCVFFFSFHSVWFIQCGYYSCVQGLQARPPSPPVSRGVQRAQAPPQPLSQGTKGRLSDRSRVGRLPLDLVTHPLTLTLTL